MRLRRDLLIVTAAALVVRVALAAIAGIDGPPVEDERGYVLLAHSLLDDFSLRLPVPDDVMTQAGLGGKRYLHGFRAPLLPLVGAILGGSAIALRVLSLVAGTLSAPVLLLSLRHRVPRRTAFLAALAYAVWPPFAYLSVRALTEPIGMLLLLSSVLVSVRGTTTRDAVGAGVLAGLSVLARPALLVPACALALALGRRRRAAVFLLLLLVTLSPWIVRNALWLHRPLLTTNSGVTLVGANSEAAASAAHPGKWVAPSVAYAQSDDPPDLGMYGWSSLGEERSNSRFTGDALRWVRENPGQAAVLAAWKMVRLVDPDPRSSKPDARTKALIGWLTLGPVLLLALAGSRATWRERRRLAPWLALAGGTILTAVIFYGDTRMRTAADPALLTVAALGLNRLLCRGGSEPGADTEPGAGGMVE